MDKINHIVYKTTNKINNKIYIGVHSQLGEDFDGYLGSGYQLRKAFSKYGIDSFSRETLYSFENEKEAYEKESELVTLDFVNEPYTYNMTLGGYGGKCHHMTTEESLNKAKETRKIKGLDQCKHMNKPEIQARAVISARKSVIKNSKVKYPILEEIFELGNNDIVEMKDTLYEISKYIFGKGRAVGFHSRLLKVVEVGKFKRGTHKGKYLKRVN